MSFLIGTLSFVMLAISLFMILLVLIQRGRGGGLAGAFGGMGGQSAFGTRAGDMFTRITIVLAVVWVLLAGGLGMLMRRAAEATKKGEDTGGFSAGADAGKTDDADKKDDAGTTDDAGKKDDSGSKSDAATDIKADVKSKADDAASSDAKTPEDEDADAKKSDATTPDAEKTDDSEARKTEPSEAEKSDASKAEKTEAPSESPPVKDVPADPATPGVETPTTEPNP